MLLQYSPHIYLGLGDPNVVGFLPRDATLQERGHATASRPPVYLSVRPSEAFRYAFSQRLV